MPVATQCFPGPASGGTASGAPESQCEAALLRAERQIVGESRSRHAARIAQPCPATEVEDACGPARAGPRAVPRCAHELPAC